MNLSIKNHVVGLVPKHHIVNEILNKPAQRTFLMYRLAYKVEFQPFNRWYLELTVFRFLDNRNRLLVRIRTPTWYSGYWLFVRVILQQ